MKVVMIIAASLLLLTGCSTPKAVEYQRVDNLEFGGIRADSLLLKGKVWVKNPNAFPVTIWEVAGTCTVGEKPAGRMNLDSTVQLPPNSDFGIPVTAVLQGKALLRQSLSLVLLAQDIPYSVEGMAIAGKGKYKKKFPLKHAGTLNAKLLERLF